MSLGHSVASLSQELGRSPTVPELAADIGVSEEAVLEALEAGQGYRATSIDAPNDNEGTLGDLMGSDDPRFARVDDRSILGEAMAKLAPRERVILHLRFTEGLTQSEIANQIGVSQMHVSRLLAVSLESIRSALAPQRDESDAGAAEVLPSQAAGPA